MIVSFNDKETERIWNRIRAKRFPDAVQQAARRKLILVNAAATLDDLRVPPGNRLEALKGDRAGQHSIRVNDQFRICFVWRDGDAHRVELTDYH